MKAEHKHKESELELEIRKHRERTIALLAEKDKEIEMLRAKSPERYENQYMRSFQRTSSQASDSESSEHGSPVKGRVQTLEGGESIVNELTKIQFGGAASVDSSILYFAHEQARKDVEINSLRRQKHSLESALRELQHSSAMKIEKYSEQVDFLKEEVRKFERNRSRESANLEYLKNVVYQYMVSHDTAGRKQMLNAISTILEFSPKEKDAVMQKIQGWWGTPKSK